jgi:phage terminase large subunit GpA-like protein
MNGYLAEPWIAWEEEREENDLLQLADDRPRGLVPGPDKAAALTCGVDTQKDGFWFEIRAWGFGAELTSWQVREGFVSGFEALERILFEDVYSDARGNEYAVRRACIDSGGHRTAEVYEFARKHRGRVIPIKGEQRMARPHVFTVIDTYPGRRKPIPGGLKLLRVDTTFYKDALDARLRTAAADPGAWLFHGEVSTDWLRQMCAEYRDDSGVWRVIGSRPNHAWDVSVYNLVAAELAGVKYIRREPAKRPEPPPEKDSEFWRGTQLKNWLKR